MYWPKPGIKRHPEKRWNRPDRIFFGLGACHILCGVYLQARPLPGFHAQRILPAPGFPGTHIFATDGEIAFDFHGYSLQENLLAHYWRGWQSRCAGWTATILPVDFPLLETAALNRHKHLGPDQFYSDPIPRARAFVARIDHPRGYQRAQATCR